MASPSVPAHPIAATRHGHSQQLAGLSSWDSVPLPGKSGVSTHSPFVAVADRSHSSGADHALIPAITPKLSRTVAPDTNTAARAPVSSVKRSGVNCSNDWAWPLPS